MSAILFVALLLGTGLGIAGRHSWGDWQHDLTKSLAEKQQLADTAEISRLRAQVALHINRQAPDSASPQPLQGSC